MTQNNHYDLPVRQRPLDATRRSKQNATFLSIKRSYLSTSMVFALGMFVSAAYANTAGAEDYRAPAAVDASAPIEALSTLTSIDNAKPLKVTVPTIQEFKTKAGVPVLFVQTTALPIVDVDLRFNAGSARDESISKNGFGIANMTATMLEQGSKSLDEEAFTHAVEMLGVNLSSSAYKDMFIVSLRSLSDDSHLSPAVDLMTQMVSEPTFDDEILARNKARLLVGLQQQKQDPGSLAKTYLMAVCQPAWRAVWYVSKVC